MTTIFISGSRQVSRINDMICGRLGNMLDQGFRIIVGDANGADKAVQKFLAERQYSNVVVFCSGKICRNNLGQWQTEHVSVDAKLKGRAFYTQKDKAMATQADYGFVIWDGKSVGSISNVFELLKHGRTVVVYYGPEKTFFTISSMDAVKNLIEKCDAETVSAIRKKINLSSAATDPQDTLVFSS